MTLTVPRRVLFFVSALVLASGLWPAPATAQVADAMIEIVAIDESGAALPGVTVTASRPDTGCQQTATTDPVASRAPWRCRPAPTRSSSSSRGSARSSRRGWWFASARPPASPSR